MVFGVEPYSPKAKGDLKEYLEGFDGGGADNLFFGPEYFFIIKDKGFMEPNFTYLRINKSPLPDLEYVVNEDYILESEGQGKRNMSFVGAKKGIYDPNVFISFIAASFHNKK